MIEDKEILLKVGRLFKDYGIKSITMDDISRELGISKKTLYQYIPEKRELVDRVIHHDFLNCKSQLETALTSNSDAIQQLIQINRISLEVLKDFSPAIEYDLKKYYLDLFEKAKNGYMELLKNAIKQNVELGKTNGIYRPELDSTIISKMHLAQIEQASKTQAFTRNEFLSAEFNREFILFHLRGLINTDGENLLKKYLNEFETI